MQQTGPTDDGGRGPTPSRREAVSRCRTSARAPSYGLVEAILVITLASIILVAVTSVVDSASRFSDRRDPAPGGALEIETAVHTVGADLRGSRHDRIVVHGAPDHDTLILQVARTDALEPSFGAVDRDGQFRDGWSIRYRVIGTQLVRQVLDEDGRLTWSVYLARDVDSRYESEKGFSVRRVASLYTVTLRIAEPGTARGTRRKSLGTSVPVGG